MDRYRSIDRCLQYVYVCVCDASYTSRHSPQGSDNDVNNSGNAKELPECLQEGPPGSRPEAPKWKVMGVMPYAAAGCAAVLLHTHTHTHLSTNEPSEYSQH